MAVEITKKMKALVTEVTGMRLEDTEKYLIETNGDVWKAVSLIRKLPDYRKQITLQMKTAVKKETGMALEDTVPYLETFNGDVEKTLEYIFSLDHYEKEITHSSKAAVMRRTGISMKEVKKYLKQSYDDIEAAVKLIEQLEDYPREITYDMKMELVNRTGIKFSDTSVFLKQTNGDIEKAVELIKSLPDFDRQIARGMIETVIAKTGACESAVVDALKKTNWDIEKAVQVVNAMPVEERVNVHAIAHQLRIKAGLSSEWSAYCNQVVIESGGDLQKAYQRIYNEIIYKDKISMIVHDTGVSESEAIYFLELTKDNKKAAVRYIKKIKQEEAAVKIAREKRGAGKILEEPENPNSVTISFQDFIVKTDVFKCHKNGHALKEITAIVYCMERDGTVIEKKIMAGYCPVCQKYYILKRDYEQLMDKYRVLCRVIDCTDESLKKGTGIYADFNNESILHQYGYTVSQQEGLTSKQRSMILTFVLECGVLTKTEICSHIDWLINSHGYDKKKFCAAIRKWKEDRAFVSDYQIGTYPQVIVNKITKK